MALLSEKGLAVPTAQTFIYCYGYGCKQRLSRRLTEGEAAGLAAAYGPVPTDAAGERQAIARAVAHAERLNAGWAGTAGDLGGSFTGAFRDGQLDCVDEAINTTTVLLLLQEFRLLTFHEPHGQSHRGNMISAWPHVSAAIREKASGRLYVVDSWFGDSGEEPHILPYDIWARGWDPETDPLPADG